MPSQPLDNTHSRTTPGVACHHHLWESHTVKRRRAWHDITALGQQTRSNDVGCHMTSPPVESTHGRTTLGVACHHHLWAAQTVERHQAWHAIIALRRQTRLDDVGRCMPSPPLDSTHGRMTSGMACHHRPCTAHTIGRRRAWHDIISLRLHAWSDDVGRGMTSPPLDCTHSFKTTGVA